MTNTTQREADLSSTSDKPLMDARGDESAPACDSTTQPEADEREPMELDEAYKLADAVYAAGYKDRHNERDYDPRKCPEWQAVVDPLIQQAAPEAPAKQSVDAHTTSYAQGYRAGIEIGKAMAADEATPEVPAHYPSHVIFRDGVCYVPIVPPAATTASASEPINTDGMGDGEIYADVSRRALASPRNAEPASTAPAKPAYTRTDAMLAFSAMCDTSLITRPAAEAMRDTLCAAVETSAPETHPKAGTSDA